MSQESRRSSPLRLRRGNLFLPAKVGRVTYWAVIDTGSTRMVVANRISAQFEFLRRKTAGGIFREVQARVVKLPLTEVLGKRYADLPAIVRPRSSDSIISWKLLLGTGVLLDRRLSLNFRTKRVEVGLPESLTHLDGRVPLRCIRGRPFVQARLGGKPVVAFVDTGSPLCQLNPKFEGLRSRVVRKERIVDGTGASSMEAVYRGPGLRLGEWNLGYPEFTREPMDIMERKFRMRVDFVLGANVLCAAGGIWTFDRRLGALSWSK